MNIRFVLNSIASNIFKQKEIRHSKENLNERIVNVKCNPFKVFVVLCFNVTNMVINIYLTKD